MTPAIKTLPISRFAVHGLLPAGVRETKRGLIVPLRDHRGQSIGAASLHPDGSSDSYDGADPLGGAIRLERFPGASGDNILLASGPQEALALSYLTDGNASVWCGWNEFPAVAALSHFVRRVTVAAAPAEEVRRLGYDPAECIAGELVAAGFDVRWLPLIGASFNAQIDGHWPRLENWWRR